MGMSIGQFFDKVAKEEDKEQKKQLLLNNSSPAVRTFLKMNYDDSVEFLLPEGTPDIPFRNVPGGLGETSLNTESKKMYLFLSVDGVPGHPNLQKLKRESLFLGLLTSLDNDERELLVKFKDKEYECGLTSEEIGDLFPGLITKPREKKVEDKSFLDSSGGNDDPPQENDGPVASDIKVDDKPAKPKKSKKKKVVKEEIPE
jgi:hypothetical protein